MKLKYRPRVICWSALCFLTATISLPANAGPMTVLGFNKAQSNLVLTANRGRSGGHHGGSMGMRSNIGRHFAGPRAMVRPPIMNHPRFGMQRFPARAYRPFAGFRRHSYNSSFSPRYPSFANRFVMSASRCDRYLRKVRRTGSGYWRHRYDTCRG